MTELSRFYGDPQTPWRIRQAVISVDGRNGGDYLVRMYSSDKLIETRRITGHTLDYAEDCAENWITGVIK